MANVVIPDLSQALVGSGGTIDAVWFLRLQALAQAVNEQQAVIAAQTANIETLRVALNQTRTAPTTVYPVVPAF